MVSELSGPQRLYQNRKQKTERKRAHIFLLHTVLLCSYLSCLTITNCYAITLSLFCYTITVVAADALWLASTILSYMTTKQNTTICQKLSLKSDSSFLRVEILQRGCDSCKYACRHMPRRSYDHWDWVKRLQDIQFDIDYISGCFQIKCHCTRVR